MRNSAHVGKTWPLRRWNKHWLSTSQGVSKLANNV